MAAAFQDVIRHQQRMASVATTIAAGDLRSEIEPASDSDILGHAFRDMLRNLRELVGQVSRSEERFRSLVQNASDATAILDPEWRITYVSPASERVWGHTTEALDGKSLLTLLVAELLAAVAGRHAQNRSLVCGGPRRFGSAGAGDPARHPGYGEGSPPVRN